MTEELELAGSLCETVATGRVRVSGKIARLSRTGLHSPVRRKKMTPLLEG